jgi:hypothetical protein
MKGVFKMAGTVNSEQKIAYCNKTAELIGATRKKLAEVNEALRAEVKVTNMQATDTINNAVVETSNVFETSLTTTAQTLTEMLTEMKSHTYIGEEFVSNVSKALDNMAAVSSTNTYDKFTHTGAGQEQWTVAHYNEITEEIKSFQKLKREYIDTLAENGHGIDDEDFTTVVNTIGLANENLTNSMSTQLTVINSELDRLAQRINVAHTTISDTASAMKIDEVNFKVDAIAGDI